MIVSIGLDLSLRATGMVAVRGATSKWPHGTGPELIHKACIPTTDLRGLPRLARISAAVQTFMDWLGSRSLSPRVIVVEGPAFSRQMGHSLGQLHGIVKIDLVRRPDAWTFDIIDAGPTVLKKFVTGAGNAEKNVVMKRVCMRWGFDSDDDNECDAYAAAMIGLCLRGELTPEKDRLELLRKVEVISASADQRSDGSGIGEAPRGRWQDVLVAGALPERIDTLISDPPYSVTTHRGHNSAELGIDGSLRRCISYQAWGLKEVYEFVDELSPRVAGWFVVFSDDVLAPVWREALHSVGRYPFAPLPFVEPGSRVRLRGDGPSCWTCWIIVARPRSRDFASWGTLPGAYVAPRGTREKPRAMPGQQQKIVGHKTQWVMRSLVRDYSRVGDLVFDPCAGSGSTLIAAAAERRHSLGVEMDAASVQVARWRLGQQELGQ